MIIMTVKVVSSGMPTYWYAKHIGEEFAVTFPATGADYSGWDGTYKVIPIGENSNYGMCYLKKRDVELIETFEGDIVIEGRIKRY